MSGLEIHRGTAGRLWHFNPFCIHAVGVVATPGISFQTADRPGGIVCSWCQ